MVRQQEEALMVERRRSSVVKKMGYALIILLFSLTLVSCGKKDADKSAPTSAGGPDNSPVVAKVADESITMAQVDSAINHLPPAYQQKLKTEEGRRYILDDLIKVTAFAKEAEKQKLDQKPETKEAIANIKKRILANELIRTEMSRQPVPGEKEALEYYKKNEDRFRKSQEYKIRQMVLKTKEEADKIYKELKAGADFARVAKERSVDPTRVAGGSVGWINTRVMNPSIAETVSKMKKGEVSQPIQSASGFHLFLAEDIRQGKPLEFDQVKPALIQTLRADQQQKVVDQLRTRLFKDLNVNIYEDKLRSAPAK